MPSLRLVFRRAADAGFWSRAIAWWTKGPYSHCELWLGGPPAHAWCFSSIEGTGTRFAYVDLRPSFDFIELAPDEKSYRLVTAAARALQGKRYDWLGLLGFVLPFGEHDEHDRFCSEVCFEILSGAGIIKTLHPEKRWRVSPSELAEIASIEYGPLAPVQK